MRTSSRDLLRLPLAAAAFAFGCGGEPTSAAAVAGIEVIAEQQAIRAGDTVSFRALMTDATGRAIQGQSPEWSSSDAGLLAVESRGGTAVAEALAKGGPVRVTATIGDVHGHVDLTIVPMFELIEPAWTRTCALDTEEVMFCWGNVDGGAVRTTPEHFGGSLRFTALASGYATSCGLSGDGTAYCWGFGGGALGDGTVAGARYVAAPVAGENRFAALASGPGAHRCALTAAGEAYCWGQNRWGQLGNGTTSVGAVPTAVDSELRFALIVVGGSHTCGLTDPGVAYCWGANGSGQLGDGTTTDRVTPVPVQGGLRFATLTAGSQHTCGVGHDALAYCWGGGNFSRGELGNGTKERMLVPTRVAGDVTFVALGAATTHTCGLDVDGFAYCWGSNVSGRLGSTGALERLTPHPVDGGHRFTRLATGVATTCGVRLEGQGMCWGSGVNGQLGDGANRDSFTPVLVHNPPPL